MKMWQQFFYGVPVECREIVRLLADAPQPLDLLCISRWVNHPVGKVIHSLMVMERLGMVDAGTLTFPDKSTEDCWQLAADFRAWYDMYHLKTPRDGFPVRVMLFSNGLTAAYTFDGMQIPELQGPWTDELAVRVKARNPACIIEDMRVQPYITAPANIYDAVRRQVIETVTAPPRQDHMCPTCGQVRLIGFPPGTLCDTCNWPKEETK